MLHILAVYRVDCKRFLLTFCDERNKLNELRDNGVPQLGCVPAVVFLFLGDPEQSPPRLSLAWFPPACPRILGNTQSIPCGFQPS
jgi:hypothetical protein